MNRLTFCASRCGKLLIPSEQTRNKRDQRLCNICATRSRNPPRYIECVLFGDVMACLLAFGIGWSIQINRDYIFRMSWLSIRMSVGACLVLELLPYFKIPSMFSSEINKVSGLFKMLVLINLVKLRISSDSSPLYLMMGVLVGLIVKKAVWNDSTHVVTLVLVGIVFDNWWRRKLEMEYLLPMVLPLCDSMRAIIATANTDSYLEISISIVVIVVLISVGFVLSIFGTLTSGPFPLNNVHDTVVNAVLSVVVVGCMQLMTRRDFVVCDIEAVLGIENNDVLDHED